MRVAITGSSGLAKVIGDMIAKTAYIGTIHIVGHHRVEDILDSDWVWKENDVFINCAHVEFEQCKHPEQLNQTSQRVTCMQLRKLR